MLNVDTTSHYWQLFKQRFLCLLSHQAELGKVQSTWSSTSIFFTILSCCSPWTFRCYIILWRIVLESINLHLTDIFPYPSPLQPPTSATCSNQRTSLLLSPRECSTEEKFPSLKWSNTWPAVEYKLEHSLGSLLPFTEQNRTWGRTLRFYRTD